MKHLVFDETPNSLDDEKAISDESDRLLYREPSTHVHLGQLIKEKFHDEKTFFSFELFPTNDSSIFKRFLCNFI